MVSQAHELRTAPGHVHQPTSSSCRPWTLTLDGGLRGADTQKLRARPRKALSRYHRPDFGELLR